MRGEGGLGERTKELGLRKEPIEILDVDGVDAGHKVAEGKG